MNEKTAIKIRDVAKDEIPVLKSLLEKDDLPTEGISDKGMHLFVGEQNSEMVAFGGIELAGDYGLLRSIVSFPDQREKGIGSLFCKQLIIKASEMEIIALYLLTTTAAPFFARLGFDEIERSTVPIPIARTAEFASICPDSAICMRLDLQSN